MDLVALKSFIILLFLHMSQTTQIEFVTRAQWNASAPTENAALQDIPIRKVIIAHTATQECSEKMDCIKLVQNIQNYHMKTRSFSDIAYNFLIGGDGLIYEGRGWGRQGSHTRNNNQNSICIAFIGNFTTKIPSRRQLQAAQLLLEEGVSVNILNSEYKLFGQRQLTATQSPGDALYEVIRNWPHWSP